MGVAIRRPELGAKKHGRVVSVTARRHFTEVLFAADRENNNGYLCLCAHAPSDLWPGRRATLTRTPHGWDLDGCIPYRPKDSP